jgi:penicillin-binding protein 1A
MSPSTAPRRKQTPAPARAAPVGRNGRQGRKLILEGVPPRGGWRKRLLKLAGWSVLVGLTAMLVGIVGLYLKFSQGLPEIPKVDQYWPPIVSEVYTDDEVLAGEFYNERRKVVPYDQIPKRLVQAFIASEDKDFFDHMGVDVTGTLRAAYKTLLKKASGAGSVQGGSTLTQQTAKAILISAEGFAAGSKRGGKEGVVRKIREAMLAFRLERALTKEEILYLYLNNVYLGHHSYGVEAAAENYYRKNVRDLTLAEMSLIAGLPQAPSRYSPFIHPDAARKRRSYVLERMLADRMLSKAEHDQANDAEIKVYPVEDVVHQFAPYFVEQVRKDAVERYGNPVLLNQGLKIFTTMDSEKQRAAQESVLEGLLQADKRQGYRGPVLQLKSVEERRAFVEKSKKAMAGDKVQAGKFYVGLVSALDEDGLGADVVVGPFKGKLPLLGMRWARKINPVQYYPNYMIRSVRTALAVGDVILVRAVAEAKDLYDDKEAADGRLEKDLPTGVQLFRLEQDPEPQSAVVSIDPHRQYLVAMVGGYDFDANEYNRAFQACRQPGSSFKPVVYSAALELAEPPFTQATVLVDSPIVEDDPTNQKRWKPQNYGGGEFKGDVLARTALTNSMNIPAVKTFVIAGNGKTGEAIRRVTEWAHHLGLTTAINQDLSSALGSSCVYPWELANLYATFNRQGIRRPTYYLRKIEDRFGRTVEDHTAYDDPWAPLSDRVAAGYARLYEPGERVMTAETGWILQDLLRNVVREGTGGPAGRLGKPAAGKTGTTNDSYDAWFAGFTRDLVTVAWVGYDLNPHPLGTYENGGRAALPIWLGYMKPALGSRPQPEFEPSAEADVVRRRVDLKTGKIAPPGSKSSEDMWFKRGTEPKDAEPEKGVVPAGDLFMQNN